MESLTCRHSRLGFIINEDMYRILENKNIGQDFFMIDIEAPRIADKAKPGQFVIIRVSERGERIPLTIYNFNRETGTISVIAQVVGKTTKEISNLKKNDYIQNIVGPLGHPSKIPTKKTVVCIGGGAGIAMIFPLIRALKELDNKVISIIGAKNKDVVILKKEIKKISHEFFITTDDGSLGRKGFVTHELKDLLSKDVEMDEVFAVGPVVMMENVAKITCPRNIKTTVSLNSIMVDGTGMCGGCRVTVGGETKFACVDGPEFDGCKVNFKELKARNERFLEYEKRSLSHYCNSD